MLITSLENGKSGKIHIYADGEYVFTVTDEMCFKYGLKKGMEIMPETVETLKFEYECASAKNKALDLLSVRNHSEFELLQKLKRKFSGDACEYAVSEMRRIGLTDDFKFAEMYAQSLFENKKMGMFRVKQELAAKGIDSSIIEEVVDRYAYDDVHSKLCCLIEKKYASYLKDEKGIRRTVSALVRLGYGYGDIYKAIKDFKNDYEYEE